MKTAKTNRGYGKYVLWFFLAIACGNSFAQQHQVTIFVTDSLQVPVSNATIRVNKNESLIDSTGKFFQLLPAGSYELSISSVGYYPFKFNLKLSGDTS